MTEKKFIKVSYLDENGNEMETKTVLNEGLASTIFGMISDDYKKRFEAEFTQLETRRHALRSMLNRYEAGALSFEPKCPYDILHRQFVHMQDYYNDMHMREKYEGITLFSNFDEEGGQD